jgi:hypothetical protein
VIVATLARENPFASWRVERIRYRPQGMGWDQIMARLEELNHRAAIVGPDGSGKTTLLEDLAGRLSGRFRVRLVVRDNGHEAAPLPTAFSADEVLLIDGADRLSWPRWRMLRWRSRRAAGLVVTSHRHGLLSTLIETGTSMELMRDLVGELTDDMPADLETLFHHHGGNVRDVLRLLYDRRAGRT